MTSSDSNEGSRGSLGSRGGSFTRDVLPAFVWTAVVFLAGALPSPTPPVDVGFPLDKLQHAFAFGVLALLGERALRYELTSVSPRLLPWLGALASIAVGGALELYQLTVPHRSAELADLVADAFGALGVAAARVSFRRKR